MPGEGPGRCRGEWAARGGRTARRRLVSAGDDLQRDRARLDRDDLRCYGRHLREVQDGTDWPVEQRVGDDNEPGSDLPPTIDALPPERLDSRENAEEGVAAGDGSGHDGRVVERHVGLDFLYERLNDMQSAGGGEGIRDASKSRVARGHTRRVTRPGAPVAVPAPGH